MTTFFKESRMIKSAHYLIVSREELPNILGSADVSGYEEGNLLSILAAATNPKNVMVGYWSNPLEDPFPDFLAIPDVDFDDTMSWLSAFLGNLAPLSQWMRIWRFSDLERSLEIVGPPSLTERLGPWVGAILAEFALESGGAILKDVSGAAPLTTSTFAAARACAVWHKFDEFNILAERHAALYGRFANDPEAADQLFSLWYVLAGPQWVAKLPPEARALGVLHNLFAIASKSTFLNQDEISAIASSLAAEFALPYLEKCAIGPQKQRVEALDRLGADLLDGPRTAATNAILGLGASFVDPGAAVLPELLRRYRDLLPMAPIWAGAFAGLWFPTRVLSDFSGLGRIISKEIRQANDLFAKPSSDISYDEYRRWTGGAFSTQTPVRALINRTLFIELYPGITTPFATPRPENSRTAFVRHVESGLKQQSFELEPPSSQNATRREGEKLEFDAREMLLRLRTVERKVDDLMRKGSSRATRSSSPKK